ncbi:ABC transporter substrate-binding protein [Guptibacillus hwajinpoensis]|uniref:Lactose/L-arabinose transport system substrate-binding protein n=1 Tax=Guptibacillus hwajinpoensis TaxID=208199 RepID=A0ABU0K009_9BACL|nr:sugar ABC transporter substrate-binding protein [Alkalihalobacillus hemicentroti]MDQ0482624.1 lactose/L-arabinose transport system substrate-binding protein [Alkalihalobacillus hemicentroti]
MKKVTGLVSMLLVLSMFLAACGNSETGGEAGDSNKVTAWAWNINVPVLEEAAKKFKEENPDFELEVVEMGTDDVYSKLTTGLQAGGKGLPDIVLVEDDRVQGYMNAFPDAFVNVSDKGFDEMKDSFPSYKTELLSKDGAMYGFPFDGGPTGVFYRTDIFEEAGVNAEDIKTWDDYIEAGKTIKEKTDKAMIGLDLNGDDGLYRMMLNQQGTFYFNEDKDVALTSEESKQAMEVQQTLNEEGLVKETVGWDAWISAMVGGDVATAPSGAWLYGSITQQGKDTSGNWGMIQLPAFEEGGNRASNLGGSNYMIPSASANADLAYDFMEFFSTNEEVQLSAMEGGLFPSLNTIYDNEAFTKEVEFFNNQPIWNLLASEMENIPAVNYTGDYAVAKDEAVKAQSEIANGKAINEALKASEERLKNRIQ